MNENDKTYSPIKNRSYSFIGNTQNISSCRPLFSQEETKYNTYETNINQNTNNKSSLNTLIALLNKKTPSTASQEPQDTPKDYSFGYKKDVSAFSLEEMKTVKKTSIIYGNIKRLGSQNNLTASNFNINTSLNDSVNSVNESSNNNQLITNQNEKQSTSINEQRNLLNDTKSYSFIGNTNINFKTN